MVPRFLVRPWVLVSAVWIGPAALAIVDQIAQRRLNGEPPASAGELLWAAGDWLVYAFLTPVIFWVSDRWPIERPHLVSRAARHLGISLLLSVSWALGGKLLQFVLALLFEPERVRAAQENGLAAEIAHDVLSWIFTTLPFGMVVYLSVMGIAHGIRYFVQARERDVQLARLAGQLSDARFSALQARLNPHFLFNTLNTIAVLVRDGDRAGSVRIVEQLSDVLRRTLRRHTANEVTLAEELELVRQYLAIEQARFSDRLVPSIDVDEALLAGAVPSFALQQLVENAIRHGIARRSEAGRVSVVARRTGEVLEITVTDDGPGFDVAAPLPAGHGLDSTRERLRALHGDAAALVLARSPGGGASVTLRVPWRALPREGADDAR